jgi:hypothetical chaperone protein
MLLARLARWHHVAFLRAPKTQDQLRRIHWASNARGKVEAFQDLVDGNYSFFLYREIEKAKTLLSAEERTSIRFHAARIDIDEPIERAEFDGLIADDLAEIERHMHAVLRGAGLAPDNVDSVFLTGGSAQIPAVRRLFTRVLGAEKLRAHDYLTSVAYGLGLSAAEGGHAHADGSSATPDNR